MSVWDALWILLGSAVFVLSAYHLIHRGRAIKVKGRAMTYLNAVAGISLLYIGLQHPLSARSFDSTAYMQITRMEPTQAEARPGDVVAVEYTVFKRPGCTGKVRTYARSLDGLKTRRLEALAAAWPSGEGTHTYGFPLPDDIAGGDWELFFTVRSKCRAADGFAATAPGERLPFTSRPVIVTVLPPDE